MLGSCFAETQGKKLAGLGMDVFQNPFGIVYNPVSIASLLYRIHEQKSYTKEDFVNDQGAYFSLEHHGKCSYLNLSDAIHHSNLRLEASLSAIQKAQVIVLTLGTSIVFHHLASQKIVANCHSLPNKAFQTIQLTFETTKSTLHHTLQTINSLNPSTHIVCTVSPVRHLRSGIIENNRSKSILISALHEVLNDFKNASYFPSYEIFIDELRDYRFAKRDLTHPNEQAEEYILKRFTETYFKEETLRIINDVEKFKKFEAHRPTSNKEAHQQLVKKKLNKLKEQYPFLYIHEQ